MYVHLPLQVKSKSYNFNYQLISKQSIVYIIGQNTSIQTNVLQQIKKK